MEAQKKLQPELVAGIGTKTVLQHEEYDNYSSIIIFFSHKSNKLCICITW